MINNFTGAATSNCGPGSSATQIVCSVDLSGLPLIQLPKKQFNISATQTIDLPRGELQINAGYSYVGSQHFFESRDADAQPDAIKEQYAEKNRLGDRKNVE